MIHFGFLADEPGETRTLPYPSKPDFDRSGREIISEKDENHVERRP